MTALLLNVMGRRRSLRAVAYSKIVINKKTSDKEV